MKKIPYKLVIFGLESAIFDAPWKSREEEVSVSLWDLIFKKLGIYELHEKLKEIFVRGGFKSYMEWSDVACCVLKAKGLDSKTFHQIINSRPFTPGVKETFQVLKKNNIITGIVSGGFEELAARAEKELDVDHILAHCKLEFDKKTGLLKDWKLFATDYKDKIKVVTHLANLNKAKLSECVFVGDDVNDIPVFKRVGLSIAFNTTKPKVKETAKVVVEGRDLRKILLT